MPPVRVLSFDQVAAILRDMDPEDILTSQAKAFHAYSIQATQTPQRISLQTPSHSTLIMPSRIDTLTSAIKIVSVPQTDEASKGGLPGVTVVMDNQTGEPRGLVNARLLTALRTAAGSALATRMVFQEKSEALSLSSSSSSAAPVTLVVFGSGAQAKAHIQLLSHVLPKRLNRVFVCNRTLPRAQELVQELQPMYPQIAMIAFSTHTGDSYSTNNSNSNSNSIYTLQAIVQSADIICTCTNTRQPLFPGEWVQPGTHLNMVGSYTPEMHEIDQTLVQRAMTLVDARKECEEEAGEFILARKETGSDGILAELGQLVDEQGRYLRENLPKEFRNLPIQPLEATSSTANQAPASATSDAAAAQAQAGSPVPVAVPTSPLVDHATQSASIATLISQRDVSIFKSVGIAAQDVAITALVLDKAESINIGAVVDF